MNLHCDPFGSEKKLVDLETIVALGITNSLHMCR